MTPSMNRNPHERQYDSSGSVLQLKIHYVISKWILSYISLSPLYKSNSMSSQGYCLDKHKDHKSMHIEYS